MIWIIAVRKLFVGISVMIVWLPSRKSLPLRPRWGWWKWFLTCSRSFIMMWWWVFLGKSSMITQGMPICATIPDFARIHPVIPARSRSFTGVDWEFPIISRFRGSKPRNIASSLFPRLLPLGCKETKLDRRLCLLFWSVRALSPVFSSQSDSSDWSEPEASDTWVWSRGSTCKQLWSRPDRAFCDSSVKCSLSEAIRTGCSGFLQPDLPDLVLDCSPLLGASEDRPLPRVKPTGAGLTLGPAGWIT